MRITNISVSGSVGAVIDVSDVAARGAFFKDEQTPWAELFLCERNGKLFPVQTVQPVKPHPCFLIFGSGKFILVGINKHSQIPQAVEILKKELRKAGYNRLSPKWKVQNVNLTGELKGVRYSDIAKCPLVKRYKTFKGLVFRHPKFPGKTITIYKTGRWIMAGVSGNTEEAAIREAKKFLKCFIDEVSRARGSK